MPGRQPRLHLPCDQWPAEDRCLWVVAAGGSDDPFGDAAGAHLAPSTRQRLMFAWRRFLGFLAIEEPSALEVAPAERLTFERARRFCAHLAATNTPYSVAIQTDALYGAARIMMPKLDWTWLKTVKARLYATAPARASKGPVITSVQLLDLGEQLMDESQPTGGSSMRMADAVQYRDGLIIALLAFIPFRRKNLSALEIGLHLVQEGDEWFFIVNAEETKTSTPLEYPVPERLKAYLATYIAILRPRILQDSKCNALWVSPKGGALSYSAIWGVTTRNTERRIGIRVSPHDFRDAAATTWALASPDQIHVARDLLGHRDLRTIKHYNRARGVEASRASAQVIAEIRRKFRRR
jgi:integrase/recombinase XerD